jgi:hypothetical protein
MNTTLMAIGAYLLTLFLVALVTYLTSTNYTLNLVSSVAFVLYMHIFRESK